MATLVTSVGMALNFVQTTIGASAMLRTLSVQHAVAGNSYNKQAARLGSKDDKNVILGTFVLAPRSGEGC